MQTAHIEVQIRERAYAIWEEEGRPEGREWDHWDAGLARVLSRRESVAAPRPPRNRASTRRAASRPR